jgi:stage II sporulation protein D
VYEGVDSEIRLVSAAIEATTGLVAVHNDEMISAYYHSTCGGMTDDIVDVWERENVAYLKPVADTFCDWSKYFNWRETFTEEQLRGRIEQYLSRDRGREVRIGKIINLEVERRTAGGRILSLLVRTDRDSFRFYRDRIRWVFGRASNPDLILPSANFDVSIDRDGQGNATRIKLRGRGYGHGVGMCQCGAIGLARAGHKFDNILKRFYTGIEVKNLY